MRAFADLLETTAAAAPSNAVRWLTDRTNVKTALGISTSDSDALIDFLIPRASKLIEDDCRLARDAAGNIPTFARETLRATWLISPHERGVDLFLPWRLPIYSIDSVVEDGTTLTVSTDYRLLSAMAGPLRRVSSDSPIDWSTQKVVVTFKAGFDVATSLVTSIDKAIESAAIEQIKYMLHAAKRDPAVRQRSAPDLAAESYTVPGGDVMGAYALLPQVRDMLTPYRDPSL